MSVGKVLSDLLHGTNNYCCLCHQTLGENIIWIDDEIFIDSQDTQTMSQLINSVFGADILDAATTFGVFCNQCKIETVNSYKFQKKCKKNLQMLNSVVETINDSYENVLPDTQSFNTVFIVLDSHDWTTKQFYDNTVTDNTSTAFQTFCSIKNTSTQICNEATMKVNKVKTEKPLLNSTNIVEPRKIRRTEFDDLSFPTEDMVFDVTDPTSYTCKICLKKCTEETKLRTHFFRYHCAREIKCSKCNRRFFTDEMLRLHEEDCHNTVICSECGKLFTGKNALHKHEQNHNLRVTCDECGRVYRSNEAFKKHITDDVCRQKGKKTADQAVHQCDYCNKKYCYKPYLAKHIMHEHGNAVGYRCQYCNKQFYTQSRLKTHILKHTREKNYTCDICNGRFVTKTSLLYHTRIHTGEKPYQCEHCDKAFLSASRRLDHMRRYHLLPSLECDICLAKFKATGSLLKHRKRHFNPNSRLNNSKGIYIVT